MQFDLICMIRYQKAWKFEKTLITVVENKAKNNKNL